MNPTIFELKTKAAQFWVAQCTGKQEQFHSTMKLIRHFTDDGEKVYGSFYRPGDFWEDPVFVCPRCVHATLIGDEGYQEPFYCKYCGSDWETKPGAGLVSLNFEYEYDDDGNLIRD